MPAAPRTARRYRSAGAGGLGHTHLNDDPLDTVIRSRFCFTATLLHVAALHSVDPNQLLDNLQRQLDCPPVRLRHLHEGAAALAADPHHIPRATASVPDAEMAALVALRPAARRKWQRSDGTV
jgi:hypothetical protein